MTRKTPRGYGLLQTLREAKKTATDAVAYKIDFNIDRLEAEMDQRIKRRRDKAARERALKQKAKLDVLDS